MSEHPVLRELAKPARSRRVWLAVRSVEVFGPDGKIHNRIIVVDEFGSMRRRYDKSHFFGVGLSGTETYQASAGVGPVAPRLSPRNRSRGSVTPSANGKVRRKKL